MGLDMYLTKKTYVKNWDFMKPEELHKVTVKKNGKLRKDIKPNRISYVIEEMGYWRKFNALHNWFVKHCQGGVDDCRDARVTIIQLKEVLEICKKIKADHDFAEKLLPTKEGFFFGNTEYGEWYFEDIDSTIEILESVIADHNEEKSDADYFYRSSW